MEYKKLKGFDTYPPRNPVGHKENGRRENNYKVKPPTLPFGGGKVFILRHRVVIFDVAFSLSLFINLAPVGY
jgi:hypothetical protein